MSIQVLGGAEEEKVEAFRIADSSITDWCGARVREAGPLTHKRARCGKLGTARSTSASLVGSVIRPRARQLLRMYPSLSAFVVGLMTRKTPPAFRMAKIARTASTELSRYTARRFAPSSTSR